MKIILFSRRQLPHTAGEICQLFEAFRIFGFDYAVNEEFAPLAEELTGIRIPPEKIYGQCTGKQPANSVMVCYGGDGTLLEGVHRLCGAPIPVMGINAGHLGFLTSAPSAGLNLIFKEIAEGRLTTEARSMIEVTGDYAEQPDTTLALNEFTVQRHGAGMISVETYVDDQMVATYHGDGVIFSTPTGSTAYGLSAGGPVIEPSAENLAVIPICAHALAAKSFVFAPERTLAITAACEGGSEVFISADGGQGFAVRPDDRVLITRSALRTRLIRLKGNSFYRILQQKL